MARKFSRRIVVDTDIARSAGETEFPRSVACRQFLAAMLHICHRVVVTPDILAEWRKHRSGYTLRWLVAMAQKKKVVECDPAELDDLRSEIAAAAKADSQIEAMLKDVHLVEAASANDRIVASLDEQARQSFHEFAVAGTRELRRIVWINPERMEDDAVEWLGQGASDEPERRLGFAKE